MSKPEIPPAQLVEAYIAREAAFAKISRRVPDTNSLPSAASAAGALCASVSRHEMSRERNQASRRLERAQVVEGGRGVIAVTRLALFQASLDMIDIRGQVASDPEIVARWRAGFSAKSLELRAGVLQAVSTERKTEQRHQLIALVDILGIAAVINSTSDNILAVPALPYYESDQPNNRRYDLHVIQGVALGETAIYPTRITAGVPEFGIAEMHVAAATVNQVAELPPLRRIVDHVSVDTVFLDAESLAA